MDNSGWWEGEGGLRQVCAIFHWRDSFLCIVFSLLKEILCFSGSFLCVHQFRYYPFQTRSIFCLLWTSYSFPPVCSAIVNHNQWREELSQSWLRWMTQVLLSLWKPSFRETHAEGAAHDSVGCSLPCQSVLTLISWHSEKKWCFCCLNMILLWPLNSSCRTHFSFLCLLHTKLQAFQTCSAEITHTHFQLCKEQLAVQNNWLNKGRK